MMEEIMRKQNNISKFLDFLYTATIGAGIPIIQSTNDGNEVGPYLQGIHHQDPK
jgi:hypothetical protein